MKNQHRHDNVTTRTGIDRRGMLKALLGGASAGLMATQLTAKPNSRLTPPVK